MRPQLAATLSAAALLVPALWSTALAGPVAAVAHGVENKVETHQESSSSPPPSDHQPDSRRDTVYYDTSCVNCGSGVFLAATAGADSDGVTLLPGPARLDLYVGGQAVVGSSGALVADIRASKDWLGISASNTSYFDHVEAKGREDSVRMDLMAFALDARLYGGGGTELWLDGGLAASSSTEYDTILGTAFGAHLEQRVVPGLIAVAQGRFFNLEADVSAFEGWAGVRAWFLSAGYRVVRFNIGPPLHGPEAGVAIRF